jgi:hypothetical protein
VVAFRPARENKRMIFSPFQRQACPVREYNPVVRLRCDFLASGKHFLEFGEFPASELVMNGKKNKSKPDWKSHEREGNSRHEDELQSVTRRGDMNGALGNATELPIVQSSKDADMDVRETVAGQQALHDVQGEGKIVKPGDDVHVFPGRRPAVLAPGRSNRV